MHISALRDFHWNSLTIKCDQFYSQSSWQVATYFASILFMVLANLQIFCFHYIIENCVECDWSKMIFSLRPLRWVILSILIFFFVYNSQTHRQMIFLDIRLNIFEIEILFKSNAICVVIFSHFSFTNTFIIYFLKSRYLICCRHYEPNLILFFCLISHR